MFAAGVDAIVESQRRVALAYFEDNSVEAACPPLKMLLHIMAKGSFEGMTITDPRLRAQFTRGAVLASDWYTERLQAKQRLDSALWRRHLAALESFRSSGMETPSDLDFEKRVAAARTEQERVDSPAYLTQLVGTLGANP